MTALSYDPMTDALDALSHMDAELADTGGGFEAIRVPMDEGEVLVSLEGERWLVGSYDAEGREVTVLTDVLGENVVETVATMVNAR